MSNFENHPIVCRDNLENTKENEQVTYSSPTRQKNSFILCPLPPWDSTSLNFWTTTKRWNVDDIQATTHTNPSQSPVWQSANEIQEVPSRRAFSLYYSMLSAQTLPIRKHHPPSLDSDCSLVHVSLRCRPTYSWWSQLLWSWGRRI